MAVFEFYTPYGAPEAPVIRRVVRTGPNSIVVTIVGNMWSRLIIYWPDTSGVVVFDSDDPTDAALILTLVDLDSEITITDLDVRLGVTPPNGSIEAEVLDQVLTTPSDPNAFLIPGRGGGPRVRGRRR